MPTVLMFSSRARVSIVQINLISSPSFFLFLTSLSANSFSVSPLSLPYLFHSFFLFFPTLFLPSPFTSLPLPCSPTLFSLLSFPPLSPLSPLPSLLPHCLFPLLSSPPRLFPTPLLSSLLSSPLLSSPLLFSPLLSLFPPPLSYPSSPSLLPHLYFLLLLTPLLPIPFPLLSLPYPLPLPLPLPLSLPLPLLLFLIPFHPGWPRIRGPSGAQCCFRRPREGRQNGPQLPLRQLQPCVYLSPYCWSTPVYADTGIGSRQI